MCVISDGEANHKRNLDKRKERRVDKWNWAAVRWEMEKRGLNGRRCSWPLSVEFVKDCATRKRKKTNNIDEIFLNGIGHFYCMRSYISTQPRRYATRESVLKCFENTHMRLRGFLLSTLARTVQI